jgi:hypothetical protein
MLPGQGRRSHHEKAVGNGEIRSLQAAVKKNARSDIEELQNTERPPGGFVDDKEL